MTYKSICALIMSMAVFATQSNATSREVGWADLVDGQAQIYEDPFRELTFKQIRALRDVVASRKQLGSETISSADLVVAKDRLRIVRETLAEQGIDADWLISQRWVVAERRKHAATAGNPDLDGRTITLSGFALSAPPAADGTPVAYLVPEQGLCSHLPPPDPNQMIRVQLTDSWRPTYPHEPVRLTGRVKIEPTEEVFRVVDGPVQMRATFLMQAEKVETMADMRAQADPAARREWVRQLTQRLRATGKNDPAQSVETQ